MEELTIKKENAIKAYKTATAESKKMLETIFGKEIFSQKITDRIKSVRDAFEELDICPSDIEVSLPCELKGDKESILNYINAIVVTRALNEGWEPDFDNSSEGKYYPYFDMRSAGSGFACNGCNCWISLTYTPARLCFKTPELAVYAGKQFNEMFKKLFIIK